MECLPNFSVDFFIFLSLPNIGVWFTVGGPVPEVQTREETEHAPRGSASAQPPFNLGSLKGLQEALEMAELALAQQRYLREHLIYKDVPLVRRVRHPELEIEEGGLEGKVAWLGGMGNRETRVGRGGRSSKGRGGKKREVAWDMKVTKL